MKTVKIKLADGQLAEMQMSNEEYNSFKEVQRPYWREEKRKQRHGLSLDQFHDENSFDIADESQNPEMLLDCRADKKRKALQLKKLKQGLIRLSDKQSSAIHKHFFWGMSYDEIAEEEQIAKSTVADRIQSALKKLKKLL